MLPLKDKSPQWLPRQGNCTKDILRHNNISLTRTVYIYSIAFFFQSPVDNNLKLISCVRSSENKWSSFYFPAGIRTFVRFKSNMPMLQGMLENNVLLSDTHWFSVCPPRRR